MPFTSSDSFSDIAKVMFPDSEVARGFSCRRTKWGKGSLFVYVFKKYRFLLKNTGLWASKYRFEFPEVGMSATDQLTYKAGFMLKTAIVCTIEHWITGISTHIHHHHRSATTTQAGCLQTIMKFSGMSMSLMSRATFGVALVCYQPIDLADCAKYESSIKCTGIDRALWWFTSLRNICRWCAICCETLASTGVSWWSLEWTITVLTMGSSNKLFGLIILYL